MPAKKTATKATAPSGKKVIPKKTATKQKASIKPTKKALKTTGLTTSFPVIPIAEAVARTEQWCNYNMHLYNTTGMAPDFARAFFVGKNDIQALHEMFQADSNLMGCRMYMGMQPELNSAGGYVWSLCIVAVEHSDTFINGIDIVCAPDSGDSLVFDFSKPCPSTCDFQSQLYHTPPPLAKAGKKLK